MAAKGKSHWERAKYAFNNPPMKQVESGNFVINSWQYVMLMTKYADTINEALDAKIKEHEEMLLAKKKSRKKGQEECQE